MSSSNFFTGGFYLNIEPDRTQLARYGLAVGDLLDVVGAALGGEMVTTTVEGRERYGVTVRYPRELRGDAQQIATQVLVPTMGGAMIPLGQLAKVVVAKGAPGIRTENALLSAYIYVDIRDRDIGSYVADAKKAVAAQVVFPSGYYATWSGQFENMEHAVQKMKVVIPGTLLIYLDHAWETIKRQCRLSGREPGVSDLYAAVMEGAVERVRPKMMTVVAIMAGLLPIMWGTGTGSEVMSRIAAPMVGGMISSTVLTLAVIPAIYALVKQWRLGRGLEG